MKDKVEMQKHFIEQIENKGKDDVKDREDKIQKLLVVENDNINRNTEMNSEIAVIQEQIKGYQNASTMLREYGLSLIHI